MKKYIFVLLAFSIFSCGDDDIPTPQCILDKLPDFQSTAACVGDDLTSWDFQGEKVYCFVYGSCTSVGVIEIYDTNCNLVCEMGGTNNLTTCDGVPWIENASNEQLIWRKEN